MIKDIFQVLICYLHLHRADKSILCTKARLKYMPSKKAFCFEFIDVQYLREFIQPNILKLIYFCLVLYKISESSVQNQEIPNLHRNSLKFCTFTNHCFLQLYVHISFREPYVSFQMQVLTYLHRLKLIFWLLDIYD